MTEHRDEWESCVETEEDRWFEEWFATEHYLKLYSHRDREEAERCVNLIMESLPASMRLKGQSLRVLDLACGAGRHAVTLAQHGARVTAVDLSPTLLSYARQLARDEEVEVTFLRRDMRHIGFREEFDVAVQMFTSFGYFDDEEADRLVLQNVRRALVDGGYYILDLMNPRHLKRSIVPSSERRLNGTIISETRSIRDGRVRKSIVITDEQGTSEFHESVRLFAPAEIDSLLRAEGLMPVQWYGDYEGGEFEEETSPRMFIVSRALVAG